MEQKKVVTNFLWRLLERIGAQGVGLIVSIFLARLLEPSAYGIIALVTVFLNVLQVFVDSGLGTALIQKKNADDLDFSTVFIFNIVMCLLIYFLLFVSAPAIARFYDNSEIVPIVRVASIVVIISGIKGIQQSYISRNMMFKKFFFATLGGTIISAVVGITLAYLGFGVWALVGQYLSNTLIDTSILWITVPWRPKMQFSWKRFSRLFNYGWKLLVARLISTVYNNLRQLFIGRLYSSEDLAYYNKGHEFPNKIVPNIESAISNVLLPTVAKEQNNIESVLSITRKAVQIMAFVIWPMMIGMAACGHTLIKILLTDRWLGCVVYLQVFCIEAAFWPISTIYNNNLNALGKTNINLKLQIVVRGIGIILLLLVLKMGPFYIAISSLIVTILEFIIEAFLNRKLIGYCFTMQFHDFFPSMGLSVFMGIIVFLINNISMNSICLLIFQICIGVSVYILGAFIFKMQPYQFVISIVKSFVKNK